ncbi:MAG TPA: hypothetical protein VLF94_05090 [Chlamydiales bacterium]|nr:hypothetical protein [Chlamydiales bacterium]
MRASFLAILFWAVRGFAAFHLTWGVPAVSLDSNPPIGDADVNPTVAIDPSGNAVATWGRTNGNMAVEDVWAASYNHSSRIWTGAVKISGGGNASLPAVAMDGAGNAIVVWEEGFPTQILSRVLSADGVWSPSLQSAPTPVCRSLSAQESPQIVVDANGNAVAIWMELLSKANRIQSAKKPVGSDWVALGPISSGENHAAIHLPIPLAMNASGQAVAVWQESNQGEPQVHAAQYINGSWRSPLFISAGESPSVAIDGDGNALFAWQRGSQIESKTLIGRSLSETPQLVSNPLFRAQHPCVGVDDAGNGVVVFERFDAAAMHKFVAGATLPFQAATWTRPIDISVPSPAEVSAAGFPRLCLNAIGDGVVIWKEFDGSHIVIQGAGYSLGTWSSIRTLSSNRDNSGSSLAAYDMGVSLNLAGNIMAIWPEDPSGSSTHHIKTVPGTGLAIAGPLPPAVDRASVPVGIGVGKQVKHCFPAHSDFINILDWEAPPGSVACYKIYRGNLSSLIATSKEPHYEDHSRVPDEKTTYLITSVDDHDHESGPIAIIVHPK